MQLTKLVSLVLLGASAALAQQQQAPTGNSSATLAELLTAPNNNLGASKFVGLLQSDPGFQPIINLLSNPGNYTAFIPNDRVLSKLLFAWKAYSKAKNLPSNGDYPPANLTLHNITLADVVSYHVLNDKVQLSNLTAYVNIAHSLLNSTNADHLGTGLPVLIENNATYSQFSNATWLQANRQYLEYEVGNGNDDTDVRYSDIVASNGYANVIDSVLIPPLKPSEVISDVDDVETLYDTLKKHPELLSTLDNGKNFTLFAPSDNALRNANLDRLSNETLKNVILNHLVEGVYYSPNFTANAAANNGSSFNLTTFNNVSLPVSVSGNNYTLNNTARIVEANIFFNNGVMHVIDRVLNGTTA